MGGESSSGRTRAHTMVTSSKIIYTVRVNINGLTAVFIMESGSTIKWRVTAPSHGVMGDATSAAIKMTKSTATEPSSGRMAESISGTGAKESSMVKEFISKRERRGKVFGRWENVLNGLNHLRHHLRPIREYREV